MANYEHSIDGIFHALSDPTRRAVVERLGRGSATVSDLARPHQMALPSFMKHIRMLEMSGLIRTRKEGRVRTCSLDRQRLVAVGSWLDAQRGVWEERTDRLEEFVTRTEE